MKIWIALVLATFAVCATGQCPQCSTMKWAMCDVPSCQCSLTMGVNVHQPLNCTALVPKCFLMKTEMYRAKAGLSTRSGGKPVESAFVDNDGIYDPDCETTGAFRAKQCNNTDTCWCVNSAGVRRTDKGDASLKCEKLVETYWVRLQLKHKAVSTPLNSSVLQSAIATAIQARYFLDLTHVKEEVQYDPDARLIFVDLKKEKTDRTTDLSRVAYYMEKDVKLDPLFLEQARLTPVVNGQTVEMEDILVYYVDVDPPTFTMKKLTGGIIAVIVVVILAVVAGLLVVFLARRREQKYSKAEPREMEAL
ncbi:epithelial cell adhesion molecule [Esox lucius]|uniref:Thyroglobulin type-1 domain-containing protein n=1 Tax=Esox lucius TaxID=8010 RepID=A0A3P8YHD8_ESOLU|nr:epithelial cell adhesion molecule [Esox lucius]